MSQVLVQQSRSIGLAIEGEGLAAKAVLRSLQGKKGQPLNGRSRAQHSGSSSGGRNPVSPTAQVPNPPSVTTHLCVLLSCNPYLRLALC